METEVCALHKALQFNLQNNPFKIDDIVCILQMRELMYREVKKLARGHIANNLIQTDSLSQSFYDIIILLL